MGIKDGLSSPSFFYAHLRRLSGNEVSTVRGSGWVQKLPIGNSNVGTHPLPRTVLTSLPLGSSN
jgi:hypothetical protein